MKYFVVACVVVIGCGEVDDCPEKPVFDGVYRVEVTGECGTDVSIVRFGEGAGEVSGSSDGYACRTEADWPEMCTAEVEKRCEHPDGSWREIVGIVSYDGDGGYAEADFNVTSMTRTGLGWQRTHCVTHLTYTRLN